MTLMQRIRRAGQEVQPGWDERDVERVWQGLKRKRRRRAVAAGAGVAAVASAGVALWALLVLPGRGAGVGPAGLSSPQAASPQAAAPKAPAPQPGHDEPMRFADGSTAMPLGARETSLAVVEDTPQRVVVALAKGGARFDVIPRPGRLFLVRAGEVTVSVLGTAFSVERVADRVGVAVTRGAVQVDWGVGARRMAAGEDGWFPPLVVSPPTGAADADAKGKASRPVRHGGAARKLATSAPPSTVAESTAPAVPPAADQHADAAKLMADADRARLAGRFEDGAALLQRLIREHPGDPRAPLAAFSLGRLLVGELGRPAEAAQAFARARALAPDGPLANDALAREAEAWARAGDPDRARAREAEYRARTRTEGVKRP
jgi:transmembrane sensor